MGTYNNNCEGCGCGPSIPEPCVTPPPVCPDPQPCTEVIDAQCVVYTTPTVPTPLAARTMAAPSTTSVQDALTQLVDRPIATIHIPSLNIGTMSGDVFASLNFYESSEWLNHNPRLFLFRNKKSKRPNKLRKTTGRPNQFVHPVHLDPSKTTNKKWWNGAAQYLNGPAILRNTEFDIPNTTPYNKFSLSSLGLDKYQWVTFNGEDYSTCKDGIRMFFMINSQGTAYELRPIKGLINNYPAYSLFIGEIKFTFAYNPNFNGYVLFDSSKRSIDYPCIVPNFGTTTEGCPRIGSFNDNAYSQVNFPDSSQGILFQHFAIENYIPTKIKRQSVVDDFKKSSLEDIGQRFLINGSQKRYKDSFYNQKIYFKLAVVIDNPNPTADAPYLIGPMSESFVLKFSIEPEGIGLRFVNDHVRGNIATS
jgi:hypothetical protein